MAILPYKGLHHNINILGESQLELSESLQRDRRRGIVGQLEFLIDISLTVKIENRGFRVPQQSINQSINQLIRPYALLSLHASKQKNKRHSTRPSKDFYFFHHTSFAVTLLSHAFTITSLLPSPRGPIPSSRYLILSDLPTTSLLFLQLLPTTSNHRSILRNQQPWWQKRNYMTLWALSPMLHKMKSRRPTGKFPPPPSPLVSNESINLSLQALIPSQQNGP